jgi:peptidoglycan hydrolase CwlO-like protein
MERVVTALTKFPRGLSTVEMLEQWRKRASGEDLWARQAQVILQYHRFQTQVKPQWVAEEAAARREQEMAAEQELLARQRVLELAAAEERAARRVAAEEAAPARWEAYVASGEASSDSRPGEVPSLESLLAMLQ